jgi:hypothetical protein
VGPALDKAGEADSAFGALKERVEQDAVAMGMDEPPWALHEFVPPMSTVIHGRALQGITGGLFLFDWQEQAPGSAYLGNAVYPGIRIPQDCSPSDVAVREKDFEEFFRRAESSAEAKDMQARLRQRGASQEAAIELLRTVPSQ